MDLELALPTAKTAAQPRRSGLLHADPPFLLHVPDLSPKPEPKPAPAARIDPQKDPERTESTADQASPVRAQIRQKRYDDGQKHVAELIDRLREKRRRFFGRLWIASVVLTALSIVALAVELIQGFSVAARSPESNPAVSERDGSRATARTSPARSRKSSVSTARAWSNEAPDAAGNAKPIEPAAYKVEGQTQPRAAWLEGTISDGDPPAEPNR